MIDVGLYAQFGHIGRGCSAQVMQAPVLDLGLFVECAFRSGPAGITALPFSEYEVFSREFSPCGRIADRRPNRRRESIRFSSALPEV